MQLRQPKNVVEVTPVFFAVSSYNYYILQTGYYRTGNVTGNWPFEPVIEALPACKMQVMNLGRRVVFIYSLILISKHTVLPFLFSALCTLCPSGMSYTHNYGYTI